MTKRLSDAQCAQYRRDGFVFPVPVLSAAECERYRAGLTAYEAACGGVPKGAAAQKTYLMLTWMDEIVRHPRILDAVEDVLGSDIMCWTTNYFIKEPHNPAFVSWHQDSTYWGLSHTDVCTAWVALSPSTRESGCMRVMPGSHRWQQVRHLDTQDPDNLLTRGQVMDSSRVEEAAAVPFLLQPGEMSLHHVMLAHASEPNQADYRRIGVVVRYIAPHVRQVTGVPDSAMLVRGEDRYGHFEPEFPPKSDLDPDGIDQHRRVTQSRAGYLYRDDASPGAAHPEG